MSKRALCASALLGTALFVGGCVAEKPPAKGPSPAVMSTASPSGAVASPSGAAASPSGTAASPSGTAASPSGTAASPSGAAASPSGAAASPSGAVASPSGAAASPVAVAPSGKPTAAPPGPGPTGAPPKVEMKAGAKPKYFLDSTKPDQAGLMWVYVLEDGAIKPGVYSAKADQPVTLFINNYGKSEVTLEVTGGSVSQKATIGSNLMGQLPLKLPAGEYKMTVGEKKATLTVK